MTHRPAASFDGNTALVGGLEELVRGSRRAALAALLPPYLARCRWFGGKARPMERLEVLDALPIARRAAYLAFVEVRYRDHGREVYVLPLAMARGPRARAVRARAPHAIVAEAGRGSTPPVLYDPLIEPWCCQALLALFNRQRAGELRATLAPGVAPLETAGLTPRLVGVEQSNSSIVFGDQLILKLLRRLDSGVSPELEMTRRLTAHGFRHTPALVGALELCSSGEPRTLAVLQRFVPSRGDAWRDALRSLRRALPRALARGDRASARPRPLLELVAADPDAADRRLCGAYLATARRLGQRTAELHRTLADDDDPSFVPERALALDTRALRRLARRVLRLLARQRLRLPAPVQEAARWLLEDGRLSTRLDALPRPGIIALCVRCHGDYHLGQVLCTDDGDLAIIDFEGEPARSLAERRRKSPALRDVAGMLRSFHYAAATVAAELSTSTRREVRLARLAERWRSAVSAAFLRAYLDALGLSPLVPRDGAQLDALLESLLLEKAIYELGYELNNRPSWVGIPLQGIAEVLRTSGQ
jgi:trehalose synthase-fused probable maltokinase